MKPIRILKSIFYFLFVFTLVSCKPVSNQEKANKTQESSLEEEVSAKGMENLEFKIQIKANPELVYKTMIDSEGFAKWTAVFSPSSHFVGSWEKGSKIHFLSKDEKGTAAGMLSRIKENIHNKLIVIENYGFVQNGEEITEGEGIEALKGSTERYKFSQQGDFTELQVNSDTYPELKGFFLEHWPKALNALKEICEKEN